MTVDIINKILDYNFKKKEVPKRKKKKTEGPRKSILVFDEAGVGHFTEH